MSNNKYQLEYVRGLLRMAKGATHNLGAFDEAVRVFGVTREQFEAHLAWARMRILDNALRNMTVSTGTATPDELRAIMFRMN
jgi:hypothetical protein